MSVVTTCVVRDPTALASLLKDRPLDVDNKKKILGEPGPLTPLFSVTFPEEEQGILLKIGALALKFISFPLYLPYWGFKKIVQWSVLPSSAFWWFPAFLGGFSPDRAAQLRIGIMDNEEKIQTPLVRNLLELYDTDFIDRVRLQTTDASDTREKIEEYNRARADIERVSGEQTPLIKRFSIDVEGELLDVCLVGRRVNWSNKRWMVVPMPNAALYEAFFDGTRYPAVELADAIDANMITFNYPGVGASEGTPSPESMRRAYRAVLAVLEKDIGAKQIVHYGWSMGGGALHLGLEDWPMRPQIEHLVVTDRSFGSLESAAEGLLGGGILGQAAAALVRAAGWSINSVAASERLECPEIVLQTSDEAPVGKFELLTDKHKIAGDRVIADVASLSWGLMHARDAGVAYKAEKQFFVANCDHNEMGLDISPVITAVRQRFGLREKGDLVEDLNTKWKTAKEMREAIEEQQRQLQLLQPGLLRRLCAWRPWGQQGRGRLSA